MSTDGTLNSVPDGEIGVEGANGVDSNANAPGLPTNPQSLYVRIARLFGKDNSSRRLMPLQPKIVKAFTSLGSTNIFGVPVDIDDRMNIFQEGIELMSTLKPASNMSRKLNTAAIALLHKQQSKPANHLAPSTQSPLEQYPFARRTDNRVTSEPLPEAQRVFEGLMQSVDHNDHPNRISGLGFALATIIWLSVARINERRPEYNETSPSFDLSPLYGVSDSESALVRAKDGRGMLSPDCFFEDRTMFLPPSASVLLILWNRNHNYIARHLLLNNEGEKWVDPSEYPSENGVLSSRFATQDDEIFHIARLINCVHFKNVVVEDFLKGLVGLPHVGRSANLDILMDNRQREKGNGHFSSVEFSLLYNCSSMMSTQDLKAAERAVENESGVPFDQLSAGDLHNILSSGGCDRNPNRRQRDSAGLPRGLDSRFKDEELAKVLQDATECTAGTPGARGTPSFFLAGETMVIERARKWNVCSLNDFRRYLGLQTLKSFKEWNSNEDIAKAAEELYGHIDNLELYPGLQAEQAVKGPGFCFGYTMTYGLLVETVTTIRSDPHFTTELTPDKLTQWGYKDCTATSSNGAFGAMLPKLLQRNLPRNYPYNNIYSLFPLTCPDKTEELLLRLSLRDEYDCEKPKLREVKTLETKHAISYVFNKPTVYPTIYGNDLKALTQGYGHFLGFDNEMLHDQDQIMTLFALIPDKGTLSRYATYFGKTAAKLIRAKSVTETGHKSIDIIRDVINPTCTRWVCETLCDLPVSKKGDEATEIHKEFAAIYAYVFRNIDPEVGWSVRDVALRSSQKLGEHISRHLPIPSNTADQDLKASLMGFATGAYSYISRIIQEMTSGKELPQDSAQTFLDRIVKSNRNFRLGDLTTHGHLKGLVSTTGSDDDVLQREEALEIRRIVANILGLAVMTSVNVAQACAEAVDFYLDDKYTEERKEIIRLSSLKGSGANATIMGYIREAQRLGQPLGLWRGVAQDDKISHGKETICVHAGDRIFADFSKAHMNAADFPDPQKIDPLRKTPSIHGTGVHKCPGLSFVDHTMPELFKAIFRLKNLRRDPGKAGRLERFISHPVPLDTDPKVYVDSIGEISQIPRSLRLLYDDDSSEGGSASKLKKKSWKILPDRQIAEKRKYMDRAAGFLVMMLLLFFVVFYIIFPLLGHAFSFPLSGLRRYRARPRPQPLEVQTAAVDCPGPTKVFQPWNINTFLPGPDDHPLPIEYTLDHPKPHKLNVLDIDARDMRMAVYVDDVLRGLTRDFELNKTVNCGESLRVCLVEQGFSAGVVVVPPGKHTVRIEWAGKDYIADTGEIEWGEQRSRRFQWMREYCA